MAMPYHHHHHQPLLVNITISGIIKYSISRGRCSLKTMRSKWVVVVVVRVTKRRNLSPHSTNELRINNAP
jgi:hypothetical protein